VAGSLKAYPNPARRKPVQFAYQLSEDASVEFRIVDVSGHEVAKWSRPGHRSDNLEVWDPQGLPAGLYVAHLRFASPSGARAGVVPGGVPRRDTGCLWRSARPRFPPRPPLRLRPTSGAGRPPP